MDARLVMFRNDGKRKDIPIVGNSVVIGRGENCDLRIPLLSVSRRHCQITVEGDQLAVKDLGSSNGTFLNNKRITEEQPLKAGDRVVIGPVIFTLQVDGVPEEIKPPKFKAKKLPATAGEPVGAAKAAEDTGAPVSGEDIDALENLVAEALKEDEEDEEDSTASRA